MTISSRSSAKRLYAWWNRNPVSPVVHWAVFLAIGVMITGNIVYSIGDELVDDSIAEHASTTRAMLEE